MYQSNINFPNASNRNIYEKIKRGHSKSIQATDIER